MFASVYSTHPGRLLLSWLPVRLRHRLRAHLLGKYYQVRSSPLVWLGYLPQCLIGKFRRPAPRPSHQDYHLPCALAASYSAAGSSSPCHPFVSITSGHLLVWFALCLPVLASLHLVAFANCRWLVCFPNRLLRYAGALTSNTLRCYGLLCFRPPVGV